MVLGGGIAGMQAALSLAGAGYGVHLVERSASLGGMIPNLHRIYPLCACCKLDSRVDACTQHPNIKVYLNTSVEAVEGGLGAFVASLQTDGSPFKLKVGAVVIAAGIETFDPSVHEPYGYGKYPNVVTSVEFEQMQRPLGPEKGVIKRPSDGKQPKRIAWLQCVGSRDINRCDVPYCSSVCCMYALKEAVNTKDVAPDTDTVIYYMDMRTHGKGHEGYLNSATAKGVRLIRSRIHSLSETQGGDILISWAEEGGDLHEEAFDMAVLSVGLRPSAEATALAERMGIRLSADHYFSSEPFKPISSSLPGVFVCGGMAGPQDISQSISQASASASEVLRVLRPEPFTSEAEYPETNEAVFMPPRILIAYHLCGSMDEDLAEEIEKAGKGLPGVQGVVRIKENAVSLIAEAIKANGANRLVFASCTPASHKPLLEEALKRAGISAHLYETVDLRVLDPSGAVQLKDRLRMGVARASLMAPGPQAVVPVEKSALVVGGGLAGMESALSIADAGYHVTLVEKEKELGGQARHVKSTWQGSDVRPYLEALVKKTMEHKNIKILTGATVASNQGVPGRFTATILTNGKTTKVTYGAAVLATGAQALVPKEYGYGKSDRIYLWSELFEKLPQDVVNTARSAVFIQCVGSREPSMPHCSNLCCAFALRSAVDLKTRNPGMNIYILFREMRAFGEKEILYRTAREKGIVFIRYDLGKKPLVEVKGRQEPLVVTVEDPILGRAVSIEADFISLQSAITPPDLKDLSAVFKVEKDSDGFLAESPEKLRPMDTTARGVFMAGLAAYPKDVTESIVQARGAAARAIEILRQEKIFVGGIVAEVRPEKCAVCCTCVRTCPFGIPKIDRERGAAYIDPAGCLGCGMCAAECPGKAIVMPAISDDMLKQVAALALTGEPN
jgi:heterodisulfide reductase subunit A